jgi:hypothetical protein
MGTLENKLVHQCALKALQSIRNQKRKDLITDLDARMTKGQTRNYLCAFVGGLTKQVLYYNQALEAGLY